MMSCSRQRSKSALIWTLKVDMASPETEKTIRDTALARTLGIKGTPAFVIGREFCPVRSVSIRWSNRLQRPRRLSQMREKRWILATVSLLPAS